MNWIRLPNLTAVLAVVLVLSACSGGGDISSENPYANAQVATFSGATTSGEINFYPTPTLVPDPVLGPGILLQDDFSDSRSGWDISSNDYGRAGYEDGSYFVEAYIEDEYYWGEAGINASDLRIEVDVTVSTTVESGNDAFGVDCRLQDNGDGYGFRISSDGYIEIAKFVNTQGESLLEWVLSDQVYTDGRTNHLTAICQGNHLQFLVNDVNVAEVVDDTFSSGDIGLSALTFEPGSIEVLFDNLIVQELGNPYLYGD